MENFFKKNIYIYIYLNHFAIQLKLTQYCTSTIFQLKEGGKGGGGNFPCSPVVKNAPCNAEDLGSIPGRGTKTPHASEPLGPPASMTEAGVLRSPCATTRESVHWQRKVPHGAMEILQAATKI